MTRRLVLAIVATTVATLIVAGLGTLILARAGSRADTEKEVRRQASELVAGVASLADRPGGDRPVVALNVFARAFRLDDVAALYIGPGGRLVGTLPQGVSDADLSRVQAGDVVSGHHGDLVYAAAAQATGRGTLVVVASRHADAGLGPAARWFVLAAAISAALATVVALTLGRRLVRPVRQVDDAARRIAGGEFATRLPDPPLTANDELADLVRSVNAMAAELQRSRDLEQQFLLSISHDLRTPLTSIRGYAEAISDGATSDPAWAAGVIGSEAQRLDRLVQDLLDLARLRARTFSLHPTRLDLGEVVRVAAEAFRPDATDAGVRLLVTAPPGITIEADGERVAQVVANLVHNALKFARSQVSVAVSGVGPSAVIAVDDDGPGIPPADLTHVFERLYVAGHEPARKESGSGLGLAIARELVGAMGGSVGAEHSPIGGARLVASFPVAPVSEWARPDPARPPAPSPRA
jgi:two-component system sensor histidine kinase BaeS